MFLNQVELGKVRKVYIRNCLQVLFVIDAGASGGVGMGGGINKIRTKWLYYQFFTHIFLGIY